MTFNATMKVTADGAADITCDRVSGSDYKDLFKNSVDKSLRGSRLWTKPRMSVIGTP